MSGPLDGVLVLDMAQFLSGPVAWLAELQPTDVWCVDVLDWKTLLSSDAFKGPELLQTVTRAGGAAIRRTCAPPEPPLLLRRHRPSPSGRYVPGRRS